MNCHGALQACVRHGMNFSLLSVPIPYFLISESRLRRNPEPFRCVYVLE